MKTCYLLYAKPYTQISDDQPATQNCVINEQINTLKVDDLKLVAVLYQ